MIYVDPLFKTTPTRRWPYTQACHMTADTHEELEAIARKLEFAPHWIQFPGTWKEHYDLTPAKRVRALHFGAKEITFQEAGEQGRQRMEKERSTV